MPAIRLAKPGRSKSRRVALARRHEASRARLVRVYLGLQSTARKRFFEHIGNPRDVSHLVPIADQPGRTEGYSARDAVFNLNVSSVSARPLPL